MVRLVSSFRKKFVYICNFKKFFFYGILFYRVYGYRGKYEYDEKRNVEYRKELNRIKWVF